MNKLLIYSLIGFAILLSLGILNLGIQTYTSLTVQAETTNYRCGTSANQGICTVGDVCEIIDGFTDYENRAIWDSCYMTFSYVDGTTGSASNLVESGVTHPVCRMAGLSNDIDIPSIKVCFAKGGESALVAYQTVFQQSPSSPGSPSTPGTSPGSINPGNIIPSNKQITTFGLDIIKFIESLFRMILSLLGI